MDPSGGIGNGGPEESLTSKEFEKFLAERAAVADNLPSISSQIGSGGPSSNTNASKDRKKKDDDDGLMALWMAWVILVLQYQTHSVWVNGQRDGYGMW